MTHVEEGQAYDGPLELLDQDPVLPGLAGVAAVVADPLADRPVQMRREVGVGVEEEDQQLLAPVADL
jgi:hypothetical protein